MNCSHFNISFYELSFALTHTEQPSKTGFLEQRKFDKGGRTSITPEGNECEDLTIKKQVKSTIMYLIIRYNYISFLDLFSPLSEKVIYKRKKICNFHLTVNKHVHK